MDPTEPKTRGGASLIGQLSHELRDALSPLASSADLARLRNFDPAASRLLVENVERGLRRALAILDSFVLSEQCENGTLQLAIRRIKLDQIVLAARDALAEPERLRYRFVTAEPGPVVQADAARSTQALVALLEHVAAQSPPDSLVEAAIGASAAQPIIRVRGCIEPGCTLLDEGFVTWRRGEVRMPLRTARCIMRLQRGDLKLVSGNHGAWELVMSFDAEGAAAEGPDPPPLGRAEPARSAPFGGAADQSILIVDDCREVRRAFREVLIALGYRVVEAADAEQALRALDEAIPDVALIDIHLPSMNGYRLAQAIRMRTGARIYLVMLSGMGLDSLNRELAREAGFDNCFDKIAGPIALRDLLRAGKHNSLGSSES